MLSAHRQRSLRPASLRMRSNSSKNAAVEQFPFRAPPAGVDYGVSDLYYSYMNEPGFTPPDSRHFTFEILHVAQAIGDKLETALGSVGLSMAKHSALTELAKAGNPLTLSELAARLSCVRSNITQLVDRLETDGLVRRVDVPSDRRSVLAELTPLGVEKQRAGAAEIARTQDEIASRFSDSDLVSLQSALRAMD